MVDSSASDNHRFFKSKIAYDRVIERLSNFPLREVRAEAQAEIWRQRLKETMRESYLLHTAWLIHSQRFSYIDPAHLLWGGTTYSGLGSSTLITQEMPHWRAHGPNLMELTPQLRFFSSQVCQTECTTSIMYPT